ncbi:MAG TPA: thioredoxin domain-containing protein [Mycobacterium sp.]|nr:thioredoxin domain-containing protein [Mycobacterium sp.]
MWHRWGAVAALALGLAGLAGPLTSPPAGADAPQTVRTGDGYGVVLGSADAPVRLEIFCEPQCPHCAEFEDASNAQLIGGIASGRVAVTYRWLTFLDDRRHNDASARLADALILAADPATNPVIYQSFVGDVYRRQDSTGDGPSADDIAAMARESGVPGPVADRIASGEPGPENIDTTAMNAINRDLLKQANPQKPSTPTVYDLNARTVVDTDEPGWLDTVSAQ